MRYQPTITGKLDVKKVINKFSSNQGQVTIDWPTWTDVIKFKVLSRSKKLITIRVLM